VDAYDFSAGNTPASTPAGSVRASMPRQSRFSVPSPVAQSPEPEDEAEAQHAPRSPLHRPVVATGRHSTPRQSIEAFVARRSTPRPSVAASAARRNALPADVSTWTHVDVGAWIEATGWGAYRARMMRSMINGRNLLRLDDVALRAEPLRITNPGHRAGFLAAIARLRSASPPPRSAAARRFASPMREAPAAVKRPATAPAVRAAPQRMAPHRALPPPTQQPPRPVIVSKPEQRCVAPSFPLLPLALF
jgi:hypothetical protein